MTCEAYLEFFLKSLIILFMHGFDMLWEVMLHHYMRCLWWRICNGCRRTQYSRVTCGTFDVKGRCCIEVNILMCSILELSTYHVGITNAHVHITLINYMHMHTSIDKHTMTLIQSQANTTCKKSTTYKLAAVPFLYLDCHWLLALGSFQCSHYSLLHSQSAYVVEGQYRVMPCASLHYRLSHLAWKTFPLLYVYSKRTY